MTHGARFSKQNLFSPFGIIFGLLLCSQLTLAILFPEVNTPLSINCKAPTVYEQVTITINYTPTISKEPTTTTDYKLTNHSVPKFPDLVNAAISLERIIPPVPDIVRTHLLNIRNLISSTVIDNTYTLLGEPIPDDATLLSTTSFGFYLLATHLMTLFRNTTWHSIIHLLNIVWNSLIHLGHLVWKHPQILLMTFGGLYMRLLLKSLYHKIKSFNIKSVFKKPLQQQTQSPQIVINLPQIKNEVTVKHSFLDTFLPFTIFNNRSTQSLPHPNDLPPLNPATYTFPPLNFYAPLTEFFPKILFGVYGSIFDSSQLYEALTTSESYENRSHSYLRELYREMEKYPMTLPSFKLFTYRWFTHYPKNDTEFHFRLNEIMSWPVITTAQELRTFLNHWLKHGYSFCEATDNVALIFLVTHGPLRLLRNRTLLLSYAPDNDIQTFLFNIHLLKSWSKFIPGRRAFNIRKSLAFSPPTSSSPTSSSSTSTRPTSSSSTSTRPTSSSSTSPQPTSSLPSTPPLSGSNLTPIKHPHFITGKSNHILSNTHNEDLPYFEVEFLDYADDYSIHALADSGSTHSFISHNIVTSLGYSSVLHPETRIFHLQTLNSSKDIPFRLCTFAFTINHTVYNHTFVVLNSPDDIFLLGYDFLKLNPLLSSAKVSSSDITPSSSNPLPSIPNQVTEIPPDNAAHIFSFNPSPINNSISNTNHDSTMKKILAHYNPGPLELPPCRETDYCFQFNSPISSLKPGYNPHYNIADQAFLTQEIKSLLDKSFITTSRSTNYYAVPFVAKGKKPRMVIDYRQLNSITIPLPASVPTFAELTVGISGKIMSALDLSSAYHHLRLDPSTEASTVFRFANQFYHWKVLPFGITNAPEVFCRFLTNLLEPFSSFCRIYLDDILVFSDSIEQHQHHLTSIIKLLSRQSLHLNVEKSTFFRTSLNWVGHKLHCNTTGLISIHPMDSTLATIQSFPTPASKKEVQGFLGHLAYISDFIPNFSSIASPLYDLLGDNKPPFYWSSDCQAAFTALINYEFNHVGLFPFTPGSPIKLTTDASQIGVGTVLWQYLQDTWHPIIFRSHKFTVTQSNWSVLDKELFAIRFACAKLKFYIYNQPQVLIETDHKPIVNIFCKHDLSAKHSRWLADLVGYNLVIKYIPGLTNFLADYLSRLPYYVDNQPNDPPSAPSLDHSKIDQPLSLTNIPSTAHNYHLTTSTISSTWFSNLNAAQASDQFFGPILTEFHSNPRLHYTMHLSSKLLYYKNRLCIPEDRIQALLNDFHTSHLAGHPGINKMQAWLKVSFYFKNMDKIIADYVTTCEHCCKVNSPNIAPGLMQPMPVPTTRWSHIAMDIVSGFPSVPHSGSTVNAALVIIDLFSSHVHFHPISTSFSGSDLIHVLLHRHFPLHGLPQVFLSDRGSQFTSNVYQKFISNLGCTSHLSVTDHHESNGKVERYIRTLQDYLVTTIEKNEDWIALLPVAEYVINSTPSLALGGLSPFIVDLGYIPSSPLAITYGLTTDSAAADNITETLDRYTISAQAALQQSFERNKYYYDTHKKDLEFSVGDKVYVNNSALVTPIDSHNTKLVGAFRFKFSGPYRITQKLSTVNYVLDLPSTVKRKSPFHISQLRRQQELPEARYTVENESPLPPSTSPPSHPTEAEVVVAILSHVKRGRGYALYCSYQSESQQPQWIRLKEMLHQYPKLTHDYLALHPDIKLKPT